MKIRFAPPQLAEASHASTLDRLVRELAPGDVTGEVRLIQVWPDKPLRLVLVRDNHPQVSLYVPVDWLDGGESEESIRQSLSDLFALTSTRH